MALVNATTAGPRRHRPGRGADGPGAAGGRPRRAHPRRLPADRLPGHGGAAGRGRGRRASGLRRHRRPGPRRRRRAVNDLLERTEARPRLTHTETGWDLHFHSPDQTVALGWAAGRLAAGLPWPSAATAGGRLGVCEADPCDRVFTDTSRNGGRRFCSTRCQNRVRPRPTGTAPGPDRDGRRRDVRSPPRRCPRVTDGGLGWRRHSVVRPIHSPHDPRGDTAVSKPVVLIAEELSPATVEALGPDFEIRHCNGADRAELLPAIADVDAILVRSATKVDAEALAAAKPAQGRRPRRRRPRQRRRQGRHPGRRHGRQRADLQHRLRRRARRRADARRRPPRLPGPRRAEERRVEALASTPASSSTRRPSASSASAASASSSPSGSAPSA